MEIKEHEAAIEAILFASGEPVPVARISEALEVDEDTVLRLAEHLAGRLEEDGRGVCLKRLENSYQMCSDPKHGAVVRKTLDMRRNTPLSQAALEILAIVAYNQPVTKAFIEQIRGVDCSGVVGSLVVKGLIEECGRLELPGRPLLYRTTPEFLRCLNISFLQELPPLPNRGEDDFEAAQLTVEDTERETEKE